MLSKITRKIKKINTQALTSLKPALPQYPYYY